MKSTLLTMIVMGLTFALIFLPLSTAGKAMADKLAGPPMVK